MRKNIIARTILAISNRALSKQLISVLTEIYAECERIGDTEFSNGATFASQKNLLSQTPTKSKAQMDSLAHLYLDIKTYLLSNYPVTGLRFLRTINDIQDLEKDLHSKNYKVNVGNITGNILVRDLKPEEACTMYGNGQQAWHIYVHDHYGTAVIALVNALNSSLIRIEQVNNIQDQFESMENDVISNFKDANGNEGTNFVRVVNDQFNNGRYHIKFDTKSWSDYEKRKAKATGNTGDGNVLCDLTIKMYYQYIDDLNKLVNACSTAKSKNQVKEFSVLKLSQGSGEGLVASKKKVLTRFAKKLRRLKILAGDVDYIYNSLATLLQRNIDKTSIVAKYFSKVDKEGKSDEYKDCVGIIVEYNNKFIEIPESATAELRNIVYEMQQCVSKYKDLFKIQKMIVDSGLFPAISSTFNGFLDLLRNKDNVLRLNDWVNRHQFDTNLTQFTDKELDILEAYNDFKDGNGSEGIEKMLKICQQYVPSFNVVGDFATADKEIRQSSNAQASWIADKYAKDSNNSSEEEQEKKINKQQTVMGLHIIFRIGFAYTVEKFLSSNEEKILNYADCWEKLHNFMDANLKYK